MDPIDLWGFVTAQVLSALLVLVCAAPFLLLSWRGPWRGLNWLSRKPALLAIPVLLAAVLIWKRGHGAPVPQVHDEFSYLLAADTFLQGRWANPTPLAWEHFETFHTNLTPAYVSMYPPGWGAVLAVFLLLTGQPWTAVIACAFAFCCATHWAARAWLPRRWAFAATAFAALYAAGGYWLNSYWGGLLAAMGGALVLGALPRLCGQNALRHAAFGTLGASILLFTRPYEGAAVLAASGVLALAILWRSPQRLRILLTVTAMLLGTLTLIAIYNQRTTGSPTLSAYQLNYDTYHQRKLFVFGHDREPAPGYRHETMQVLYTTALQLEPFSRNWLEVCWFPTLTFYSPGLLLLILGTLPWLLRNARYRGLVLIVGAGGLASLLTVWVRPHYLAPAAAAFAILGAAALRLVSARHPGAAAAIFFALAITLGVQGTQRLWDSSQIPEWLAQRNAIQTTLAATPGQHLVIVRYGYLHNPNYEWVFNRADFSLANSVIWARSMGEAADQALAAAYPQRKLWIVEPEVSPKLRPFTR